MKNTPITFFDHTVHPGESANLALPLPQYYSCAPLYMPIKVIHGKKKGPCVVLASVIKGNELNGLEIANRVTQSLNPNEISGTVISVPVLNVFGLTHYPKMLPSESNLQDCFPGNEIGSYGERLAYLFTQEILAKAQYLIEYQTGEINHNILPHIYCNFDNSYEKKLAKTFQTAVITDISHNENSLWETAEDLDIRAFIFQAGEALRFDFNAITVGVEGTQNFLKSIEVLNQPPNNELTPISSREEKWIITHKGGLLHIEVNLGQIIKKNELLGKISDPFGADTIENIYAQEEGIIVGTNTSPLVHEGLPVFKIASLINYAKAETLIEEWDQKQSDSFIG